MIGYLHVVLLLLAPPSVSTQEVLGFMREIPACERLELKTCQRPGRWDQIGAARRVAEAISVTARSREEAARMALYAAWEGGNMPQAVGDNGKSLGVFQLQNQVVEIAFDPLRAARAWLRLADSVACLENPPEERYAALASGSCFRGRAKVRRREEVVQRILAGSEAVAIE